MISYINSVLNTIDDEICFTRPRRFGKTSAADMLCAYYSCGCDSRELFKNLKITDDPSFEKHLNQYPVIYFALMPFMNDESINRSEAVKALITNLKNELALEYPDAGVSEAVSLHDNLLKVSAFIQKKFIIIIDEWDMILREEQKNLKLQDEYISLLRSLFRGPEVSQYLACAYMSGILPIIKYNTQSALSDLLRFKRVIMKKPFSHMCTCRKRA